MDIEDQPSEEVSVNPPSEPTLSQGAREMPSRRSPASQRKLAVLAGVQVVILCLIALTVLLLLSQAGMLVMVKLMFGGTSQGAPSAKQAAGTFTPQPYPSATLQTTQTPTPTEIVLAPTFTNVPTPTPDPADWKNWPVVPQITSSHVREIYQAGQKLGNNPVAFSKVGDSNSTLPFFLGCFDWGPRGYKLDRFTDLQPVIAQFSGSFNHKSRAVKNGLTGSGVLSLYWEDDKVCGENESAMHCEYRTQKPSFAIIALGTNDVNEGIGLYEANMRKIIERSLDLGIVPILGTKADNLEGTGTYNQLLARLSLEYDIPLWNYWAAVQKLPEHGMRADGAHLTFFKGENGLCDFYPSMLEKYAWPVRNLTALQALNAVWKAAIQS